MTEGWLPACCCLSYSSIENAVMHAPLLLHCCQEFWMYNCAYRGCRSAQERVLLSFEGRN